MKFLELKIPPLALVVICIFSMWFVSNEVHISSMGLRITVWLVSSTLAAVICVLGVREFKKSQTTVNPMNPESSSSLVQTGIYQYTRNPMYLGFALFLFACGFLFGDIKAIALVPLFVVYLTVFQIKPEEIVLGNLFGNEYTAYKEKVRRWL